MLSRHWAQRSGTSCDMGSRPGRRERPVDGDCCQPASDERGAREPPISRTGRARVAPGGRCVKARLASAERGPRRRARPARPPLEQLTDKGRHPSLGLFACVAESPRERYLPSCRPCQSEANLPAQPPAAQEQARLSKAHAHPRRSGHPVAPTEAGPQAPGRLIVPPADGASDAVVEGVPSLGAAGAGAFGTGPHPPQVPRDRRPAQPNPAAAASHLPPAAESDLRSGRPRTATRRRYLVCGAAR